MAHCRTPTPKISCIIWMAPHLNCQKTKIFDTDLDPRNVTWSFGDECDVNSFTPFNCNITKKKSNDVVREVNCIFFKYGPTDTANAFQVSISYDSASCSFSLMTVWVCIFGGNNISEKAALKCWWNWPQVDETFVLNLIHFYCCLTSLSLLEFVLSSFSKRKHSSL